MARIIVARPRTARVLPREVLDAKARARQLIADAEADAEALRTAAHASGYLAGHSEALRGAFDAAEARDRSLADAEALIVRLGLAAAEKLLQRIVEAEPEQVLSVVRPLLERMRLSQRIELHLHPDDAPTVRHWIARARGEDVPDPDAPTGLSVVEEPTMTRGGCLVVTERGTLDARVETQLGAIERALLGTP